MFVNRFEELFSAKQVVYQQSPQSPSSTATPRASSFPLLYSTVTDWCLDDDFWETFYSPIVVIFKWFTTTAAAATVICLLTPSPLVTQKKQAGRMNEDFPTI